MYDLEADDWMDRKAYGTQTYQWVNLKEDVLSFKAYTALGELYDAFEIHKDSNGINTLINQIPNTPERLQGNEK
ncbi:hypothetical protein J2X69_003157 [Algoriphagus sp. 4150]|uniref:hypothetical protein n=1 Tax=Algoriphagus sp. 4150 TaxID=2817756 RepID=UPI0028556F5C|nr:hypothetical protein [Algoriphagus sp. 4150]MDR7130800.1 hypothetical protein [Algoriphagus sp. 4150]